MRTRKRCEGLLQGSEAPGCFVGGQLAGRIDLAGRSVAAVGLLAGCAGYGCGGCLDVVVAQQAALPRDRGQLSFVVAVVQ